MEKRRIKVVIEVNPIPNSRAAWKGPMSRWGSMIRHDILFWREKNHIPRLVHNKDTSSYRLKYYVHEHGQYLNTEQSPVFIITQKYLYGEKG